MGLKKKTIKVSLESTKKPHKKDGEKETIAVIVPTTNGLLAITKDVNESEKWVVTHVPTGCRLGLGEKGSQADALRRAKKFYHMLSEEARTAFRTDDFRAFGPRGMYKQFQPELKRASEIVYNS